MVVCSRSDPSDKSTPGEGGQQAAQERSAERWKEEGRRRSRVHSPEPEHRHRYEQWNQMVRDLVVLIVSVASGLRIS